MLRRSILRVPLSITHSKGMKTQALRAQPHIEIGSIIENHAEDILERWCRRALEEQPTAERVRSDVLRNHLSRFLRAVGRALRSSELGPTDQHCEPALEHGEQRWNTGWTLEEVVRDYQLLRVVILEVLEGALERRLSTHEIASLGVFIDDAISASIAAYVENRDEEAAKAEQLRQQELEASNRRKDEFLGVLGHELRNPLAPIRMSLHVVQSQVGAVSPAVSMALGVLDRQSQHLARLVDDLLDLSRIGQGRFELRRTKLRLADVFGQVAQAIAPLLDARHHTFVVQPPHPSVEVDADQDRLIQILSNLLNNAAKYTPPGGSITLTGEADEVGVVIRVRDTGVGIPADRLNAIFDLFTQLESGQHLAQGGLGIGLALVRGLVEQHGGAVTCESAGEGQGSEFIVRLPHPHLLELSKDSDAGPLRNDGQRDLRLVQYPKPPAIG